MFVGVWSLVFGISQTEAGIAPVAASVYQRAMQHSSDGHGIKVTSARPLSA
jgi:hypothetical protein